MDIQPELLNMITNGSIASIVFIVWYLSFKQFHKQQEEIQKEIQEHIERMFTVMEQDIKYKEALTGILSRLELKIDLQKNPAGKG